MKSAKIVVDDLGTYKQKIRACTLCESFLPLGTNPVVRGNQSAKILIAGQAPGLKVHNSSIPFDDPSGKRLREWLAVTETEFYDENKFAIVPMGFCYPGKGKSGDLPPRVECAKTWHKGLLSLLPNIKLTLVIGQYAQAYYLGKKKKENLTATVQAWQEYAPDIIPLPHPSPRNNIWLKRNPWFENDVLEYLKSRIKSLT